MWVKGGLIDEVEFILQDHPVVKDSEIVMKLFAMCNSLLIPVKKPLYHKETGKIVCDEDCTFNPICVYIRKNSSCTFNNLLEKIDLAKERMSSSSSSSSIILEEDERSDDTFEENNSPSLLIFASTDSESSPVKPVRKKHVLKKIILDDESTL